MERFEYKVLTNRPSLLFRPRWRDGDERRPGWLKDILPSFGEDGWEVCGVASGATLGILVTFQVILKRRRA
jgi:hypothetical protein